MTASKPNVLFIQADQLKPQVLPAYGGAAITPHIDTIVEQGVVFENAYCNFPLCAPSRFSMLAGQMPSKIGAYDNGAEFFAQIPTMAHYMRLAGYQSCLSGKQHFVGPDMLHGFHERLTPELYPTDFSWTPLWGETRMTSNNDATGVTKAGVCARSVQLDHDEAVLYRAVSKLHDYARGPDEPFFLVASFTHPHEPYYAMQEYWDLYRHEDIPMPETPLAPESERSVHTNRMLEHHALLDESLTQERVRVARHGYYANVSYVDHAVGQLLKTLKITGLYENTIIVLTADHGDMLGEHGLWFKKHFFDGCVRVPLLIAAPNRFRAGRVKENVSLVDLLPTLADFAGFSAHERSPDQLDGESLVPFGEDNTRKRQNPVFSEITSESVPSPMLMVKRGGMKLITGGEAPDTLFDTENDPHERTDLANDESYSAVKRELIEQAEAHWDTEALTHAIMRTQRRRRLVDEAHQAGIAPQWDYRPSEPTTRSLLRAPGDYNSWAWTGIE